MQSANIQKCVNKQTLSKGTEYSTFRFSNELILNDIGERFINELALEYSYCEFIC